MATEGSERGAANQRRPHRRDFVSGRHLPAPLEMLPTSASPVRSSMCCIVSCSSYRILVRGPKSVNLYRQLRLKSALHTQTIAIFDGAGVTRLR